MGSFDVLLEDERTQLEAFIEDYRSAIERTLDGLTEDQVRARCTGWTCRSCVSWPSTPVTTTSCANSS
jgi:hypothetical protein